MSLPALPAPACTRLRPLQSRVPQVQVCSRHKCEGRCSSDLKQSNLLAELEIAHLPRPHCSPAPVAQAEACREHRRHQRSDPADAGATPAQNRRCWGRQVRVAAKINQIDHRSTLHGGRFLFTRMAVLTAIHRGIQPDLIPIADHDLIHIYKFTVQHRHINFGDGDSHLYDDILQAGRLLKGKLMP